MKTRNQISRKARQLKKKLIGKVKEIGIYENFGYKELNQLKDFVGDTYSYGYEFRLWINHLTVEFANWCMNYTGH